MVKDTTSQDKQLCNYTLFSFNLNEQVIFHCCYKVPKIDISRIGLQQIMNIIEWQQSETFSAADHPSTEWHIYDFIKEGPFLVWSLMLSQRGVKTFLSIFFLWPKLIFFWPKGAMAPIPPPQTRHWMSSKVTTRPQNTKCIPVMSKFMF